MLVSIVTASYNYARYIGETIESVINQTYKDWELIIVDDGSSDNSVEIIKSYCQKDNRIKLYQHENGVNKGLPETLKLGISKAGGEWISFLESDDKYMPNYLEEKIKVIDSNPDVKYIFSDFESFEGDGIDKIDLYKKFKEIYKKQNLSLNLIEQNVICTFSIVMLKKELFSGCDFNTPIPALIDWWLWIQIAQKTNFYYLDKKLTMWRIHSDSFINSSGTDKIELIYKGMMKFYDKSNWKAHLLILLQILKSLRKKCLRIRFGKKAQLVIFGKTIYKNKNLC